MNAQEHIEYLEGQLAAVNLYLGFLLILVKVSLPAETETWKTTFESFKSVQFMSDGTDFQRQGFEDFKIALLGQLEDIVAHDETSE